MKNVYAQIFKEVTNLHCIVTSRMVQGNIVIDKEHVQFGGKTINAIAMYHIEENKIKKVYFIQ